MAANPIIVRATDLQPVDQRPVKFKLGSFKNVSDSVTDTFQIPLGMTIHKISLHCKTSAGGPVAVATIANDITGVRVKVNGDSFIEMTPTFANIIKPYYGDFKGAANVAGILPIPLAEKHLDKPEWVQQTAWGTNNIDGLSIELDFGTLTATTGLNGGSVDVWVHAQDISAPLGLHRKIRQITRNASATGETEFSDLPLDNVLRYRAIHINDSGYLSLYRVKLNTQQIRDSYPVAVDQEDQEESFRNPQSNYRTIDFNLSGELYGGLPILSNPTGKVTSLLITNNYTTAPNAHKWWLETLESYARKAG